LVVGGGLVFAALGLRWKDDLPALLTLLGFAAALLILLATDLDQKLLPNLITLPMIVAAAVLLVGGWSPLLAGKDLALVSGIAAAIGAPLFLFLTDRLIGGALGDGDLKLAVSLGLLAGVSRLLIGFVAASIAFAAVILVLLAFRRVGLKTAIPLGPMLIGAAFVAMLVR
jgi:leader peptidase (prepilin peptidase)/N-methyltransferase